MLGIYRQISMLSLAFACRLESCRSMAIIGFNEITHGKHGEAEA